MKPLLTTIRGLKEMASGLAYDAIDSSPTLFMYRSEVADVLVADGDDAYSQRVIINRQQHEDEEVIAYDVRPYRREVLGRMAAFAERAASSAPLSLPRGWHQYKYRNMVAFFATSSVNNRANRWIADVSSSNRRDVTFLELTSSTNKMDLKEYPRPEVLSAALIEELWAATASAAAAHFSEKAPSDGVGIDISLPPLAASVTKGWTYDQWLGEISADQRHFVLAPTDRSIRLRGPAGSGKTLALTLKALREVSKAREDGTPTRVLIVTHSWSLATEIADSVTSMGMGIANEIDVFPLLEIAQSISPHYVSDDSEFSLLGTDSLSGKQAQLLEIQDLLDDFIQSDWITYRDGTSPVFAARFDVVSADERRALEWDLLVEFGSVIGAAAIFPGAGAEARYAQLSRAGWMMPIETRQDQRVVFELYSKYMARLESRSLLTSDQVLADLLNHLETHAWNRARKQQGYDLIFVDEFHLFSPLERQVLHYLSRDVSQYPRVFMAVDPRQSPSEAFIGLASDDTHSDSIASDDGLGIVDNFELTTVHRFTPEILDLIKHVHHRFPTLDLGEEWHIDFDAVESTQSSGTTPRLILAASQDGELYDINSSVQELYPGGRIALAVVDQRQWGRVSRLAAQIGMSGKYRVSTISGRSDVEALAYRHRGLIVAPAEYLAGLQFETVLVAGIPDLQSASNLNDRTRFLSLLYLAVSRAEREVRLFVNDEDGAIPDVLSQAISTGVLTSERGSLA